jgi:hypothetical protein
MIIWVNEEETLIGFIWHQMSFQNLKQTNI